MKSYTKNIARTILNNKKRYFAMLLIIALGVAFFVGLRSTSPDMNLTLDNYFDDRSMYDIRVLTTLGLTNEDVELIQAVNGTVAVAPSYYCDEFIQLTNSSLLTRFYSYNPDTGINTPLLIEGAYPENADECLVDNRFLRISGHSIGEYITVITGDESDIFEDLKYVRFKITGAVNSPLYITETLDSSKKGHGTINTYVFIPQESFNLDVYTEIYIKTDIDASRFTGEYVAETEKIAAEIETVVDGHLHNRYEDIIDEAETKINDARIEIADARTELENAKTELDSVMAKIAESKAELEANEREFAEQKEAALQNFARYGLGVAENNVEWNDFPYAVPPGEEVPESNPMLDMYNKTMAEFDKNEQFLMNARNEWENAKNEADKAEAEYIKSVTEAEAEFAAAEAEIADYEEQLSKLKKEEPESYVLDLESNAGFVSFKNDSERIDAIGLVFPLIFFLVAALVTMTNMLRIVEDDRASIGVLKSLGYNRFAVLSKYLIYALLVVVPGSLVGAVVGCILFPYAIINFGYRILYKIPEVIISVHLNIWVSSFIMAAVSIFLPVIGICYKETVSVPANLLRPKSPPIGKRVILERIPFIWNRLNFFAKVTVRNILRYKKRFFMTVIGIAGCTALMLTGFGIMDSIKYIPVKQFGRLLLYDSQIRIKENADTIPIENILNNNDVRFMYVHNGTLNAGQKEVSLTVIDTDGISDFIRFYDLKNNEFSLNESGVIITDKLSRDLNIRTNDTITLTDADNNEFELKVTGITENYIHNYVYMTPSFYENTFGNEPAYNTIIIKIPDVSAEKEEMLSTELLTCEGITGISFNSKTLAFYSDMINSLNFVVIILILSAAALAFIVLFSLTTINIDERARELATLKVLGFFNPETSNYILRENIILTVIGTCVGLLSGVGLHRYVITTVEPDIIMFSRNILPLSYVWSALLTFLFSAVVSFIMSFIIKKINMVESLKSIE